MTDMTWRLIARYGDVFVYERDGVRWYRPRMSDYEQKVREISAAHLVHCFNDDVGTKVKVDEEEHGTAS